MNHIYEDIQGWLDFQDIYTSQIERVSDGAVFVEIGAWKGKSSSFMAVEIINSGKKIDFHVVDTFEGSHTETQQKELRGGLDLLGTYKANLAPVMDHPDNPIILHHNDSVRAAKEFEDGSVDFVFIDGNHLYPYVKADIKAWLPKVKKGGVLAGHDWRAHPEVQKAVREFFPEPKIIHRSWLVEC